MTDTPPPADLAATVLALLDLERLDTNLYRGPRKPGTTGRVFGGQVVAQALMAAQRTTDPTTRVHSMHAYFLRAGDETLPIIFQVERDFDGKSFANRRVTALQNGLALLTLAASFQRPEPGLTHTTAMPVVPPPENLLPLDVLADDYADHFPAAAIAFLRRPSAFEIRPCATPAFLQRAPASAVSHVWIRLRGAGPQDPAVGRGILAYLSDYALLSASLIPHGINMFDHSMQVASLDHAVWFHDDPPLADWLLYSSHSPWSGHGRGIARGMIHSRDGRLIAHVAQEGLIRMRPDLGPRTTVPHLP
ncbi:acyl-CoA thioesterase II [Sphingomonas sp. TREG-RG-20F-R18-01]|uniref:acyl-CoA thioesterase n=1 Tax=Sphingomonas sp. TREG-RG-20F-R18-01 TaxID=2914982 RepID=UPI001F58C5FA|nr:acyl-CoA thioesterase II [Sphingomonas sp. TREG-RG-20F-R18-01]